MASGMKEPGVFILITCTLPRWVLKCNYFLSRVDWFYAYPCWGPIRGFQDIGMAGYFGNKLTEVEYLD